MKKHLSILFYCMIGLLMSSQMNAQCSNVVGTNCNTATLLNCLPTTITTQEFSGGGEVFNGCPNFSLDNPGWYRIEVSSTVLGLRAVPNCENGLGFQMALYADCLNGAPGQLIAAPQCACTNGPVFLQSIQVTPGTYYLVVDGCSGDFCEIDLELTQGSIQSSTVILDDLLEPIASSDNVCPGEVVDLQVNAIPGAEFYNWSFPPGVTVLNTNCENAVVIWGNQGGAVTVTAGSFCLGQTSTSPPKFIDVPRYTTSISGTYCFPEQPGFFYATTNLFYPAGTHDINLISERGCDSLIILSVEELTSPPEIIDETLCDGEGIIIAGTLFDRAINTTITLPGASVDGCDSTILVIIDVAPALELTAETGDAQCDACNGFINLSVSGGTPSYSFRWSNNSTSEDISGLCAGNYTVTITDNNDCSMVANYTVNNAAGTTLAVTALVNHPDCPGSCDGSLMLNFACGTPPYQIDWEDGLPDDNAILGNLCAGSYSVTVTDSLGLSGSTVVELVEPSAIAANPTISNISCFGLNDGSISLDPFGGTPPYNYRWRDLSLGSFPSRNNLPVGDYTAIITDAKGCEIEITIPINEPAALALNIEANNLTCSEKGSAIATVSGGTALFSYLWSNGEASAIIDNLEFGDYSLTVTDANGCSISQDFEIIDECCELAISLVASDIPCGEGNVGTVNVTIDVDGTAPYTIEWNDPDLPGELVLGGLEPGNYEVTITDATGCKVSGSAEVLAECCPEAFTLEAFDETCTGINDGSVVVQIGNPVTPPYSFEWSNPNLPNEPELSDLLPGVYSLTLTNGDGCSKIETFEIASSLNLVVTTTPADCDGQGGTATASADGFFLNFFWSNGGNGASQSNLAVGDYSVTVYNLFGGCRSAVDFRIEEDPACPDNFVVAPNNLQLAQPEQPTLSMQLSPNPAVDRGFIRYALEEATAVTLEIYDLQGRVVRSLERAQARSAGEYFVEVNLNNLANGIYIVKLENLTGEYEILNWMIE